MEQRKLCAIFGENPDELVFGYDEENYLCAEMKYRLVVAIREALLEGYMHFTSTVEQGAAMWAAETCDAIKQLGGSVTITAAPMSETQADRWHPERRERYFTMLERADEVIEPCGECCGVEYIMNNAELLIILGDSKLPRLARLIATAEERGISIRAV